MALTALTTWWCLTMMPSATGHEQLGTAAASNRHEGTLHVTIWRAQLKDAELQHVNRQAVIHMNPPVYILAVPPPPFPPNITRTKLRELPRSCHRRHGHTPVLSHQLRPTRSIPLDKGVSHVASHCQLDKLSLQRMPCPPPPFPQCPEDLANPQQHSD